MNRRPEVLVDEATLAQRVGELAEQISRDYAEARELYLVGVLKGAFIFLADLCRRLTVPHRVDFIAISSYGESMTSGDIRLVMDLRSSIEGRHVLVVDDIIDTGATLDHLMDLLRARRPASLRSCILVRKDKERHVGVESDYLGFDIHDVWVVGYGLDHADRYRTLPYIGVLPARESSSSDPGN